MNVPKKIADDLIDMKIIGVGGGGISVTNQLMESGMDEKMFISMDTDSESLCSSLAARNILLGENFIQENGTGGYPDIGERAAKASWDDIKAAVMDVDMVFVIAGIGGGTGTGAAPVVASCAHECGALTIAIAIKPFSFEGIRRERLAEFSVDILRKDVDISIVIANERLSLVIDDDTSIRQALHLSNEAVYQCVMGISNFIKRYNRIQKNFVYLKCKLKNSGRALFGMGVASGDNAALKATHNAIEPLLKTCLNRAGVILLDVKGNFLRLMDLNAALGTIRNLASPNVEFICNVVEDDSMDDKVMVNLLATRFDNEIYE